MWPNKGKNLKNVPTHDIHPEEENCTSLKKMVGRKIDHILINLKNGPREGKG